MKDLEMRTKDHIPLDFLYTNRTIFKPSKAKQRWAKHEVVKMTNAKKLNRKNENILEELAGLKDDNLMMDDDDNHDKFGDELNADQLENIKQNDEMDLDDENEEEDQIDQPNPINLNKPMDEPDHSMTKNNMGSKGTLDLNSLYDTHPLIGGSGTNGMTPNKLDQSTERLDYSFIGSQVGYNVNRDIEDQINKIDDLEQVPEEEEDEEEVDWWDLMKILLLHTHPFMVLI
jgi:hypothetical protein